MTAKAQAWRFLAPVALALSFLGHPRPALGQEPEKPRVVFIRPEEAEGPAAAQAAEALAPDQPVASFWFPNDLLSWSPGSDAPFNRGRRPLATRFFNPAQSVNPHARPGEARIAALVGFAPTSNNPSQGSNVLNYYALNYWQYIDVLVFFGGSASEGVILAPNPTVIDAAHRNGVPVLGNVFMPPTAFGGQIQWVRDLVQKSGSSFPVADKLIEVAEHYGFDGWFINQETAGGDAALAGQVRDFIKYIQANSSLRVIWYDAMTESGSVAWQNALTGANDMFLQSNGRVADDMFLNFAWSTSGLSSSRSLAQSLGRSPYELYAGVDVQGNGYNTSVNWSGPFPEGQSHVVSLGFYRPEWTFKSSTSHADFYQRDSRFWIGANGNPSNTTTASAWKGLAHYLTAKSPITSVPFVTNFNTGQGTLYAVNGQVLMAREWNNLSLQDVLPTWRWIVQSSGAKLTPALDFTDAYYGGTSLRVSGSLSTPNDLKLFQTRLDVASDTSLRIAYKTGASGTPSRMKVGLAFEDSPASFQYLDVGSTASAGWNTRTFSLSSFTGRTLAVIGLRFESSTTVSNYAVKVGQIAVFDGSVSAPDAPSGVFVERKSEIDADRVALRLRWTQSTDPVYYYNVYRRNPDGSRTYLGGTPNDAYFVPEVNRMGSETSTTIEVEAVGLDFGHSSRATTSFDWDAPPPSPAVNLALNKPATGSTPCNASEGPAKAVNGSVSGGNTDKWCSATAPRFLQVDLGVRFALDRFVVRHAGAGGESASLNTRDFSIGVSSNGTSFTTVVSVTGNTASVTTHGIPATLARYVRLSVTTPTQTGNASARIYEFEVYGSTPVVYETESLAVAATSGDVHRVAADSGYNGGSGTILEANAAGDFVAYTVDVPEARTYDVRVRIKRLGNRGIWQLASNGVNHGHPVDGYSASSAFAEVDVGNLTFPAAGNRSLRFTVTGRNGSSSGFWIALDTITLIPQ